MLLTNSDYLMSLDIAPKDISAFRTVIIEWEMEYKTTYPWRISGNRWHALVAEIMLQRTRADQVIPVYHTFCNNYPTPLDFINDKASNVFANLGLYWRSEQLRKLSEIISDTDIPSDKKELLKLPGVGNYIASAYRSLHLGIRDYIIDSNVVRLYGRYFGYRTDAETRRKKWFIQLAYRLTPKQKFKEYNYGLIDYTREICKIKPLCSICKLNRKCHYYQNDKIKSS